MVTFLLLLFILIAFIYYDKTIPKVKTLLLFIMPLFFIAIWGIEYSMNSIPLFNSDEVYFASFASSREFYVSDDRYFVWGFINYFIGNYDIYAGGLPLKLINIPISISVILLLYKIFDNNKTILLLPFLLPYYAWLSIFNLRDILILFFITLSAYLYKKNILFCYVCLLPLFWLRPLFGSFIALLSLVYEIRINIKTILTGYFKYALLIALISIIIFHQPVFYWLERYFLYSIEAIETGGFRGERLAESGYLTGDVWVDYPIAVLRYFITPMPHSVLYRDIILEEYRIWGWGLTDSIIRFFNQVSYYFLLIILLVNLKSLIGALRQLSKHQVILLSALFMYWPIYSFYLHGVMHYRLKIPFHIFIFLLFVLTMTWKKRMHSKKISE